MQLMISQNLYRMNIMPTMTLLPEEGNFVFERGPRGRGKSVNLPMSLKFDGKSNWKAFYAKFSCYAEVSEWTEGECRDQLC